MPINAYNAHATITEITKALFSAEERRLEQVRDQLVVSNKECYPHHPHDGFTYRGETYDTPNLPRATSQVYLMRGKRVRISTPPIPRTRVSLHLSLVDTMDEYLSDMERVWTDRYSISQMLFTLLNPCENKQDIRDALPNCIVDTLEDLRGISRIREEAYTIKGNDRTYRQYLKVRLRMEFYAISRLLY